VRTLTRVPDEALSEPSSPFLLDVARWWSLPISSADALAWVRAHPPSGLRASAQGSGTGPGGPFPYLAFADTSTEAYTQPTLLIEVVSRGSGESAMRADGQTVWVPLRPPVEKVPPDVSAVRLRARRGGKVIARRRVSGSTAADLVRLANALDRDNRGVFECAMDNGLRMSVTFASPERTLVFTENPACLSVSVRSGSRHLPALFDSPAFERVTRADLHVPGE
jgi:hypothetical protein